MAYERHEFKADGDTMIYLIWPEEVGLSCEGAEAIYIVHNDTHETHGSGDDD